MSHRNIHQYQQKSQSTRSVFFLSSGVSVSASAASSSAYAAPPAAALPAAFPTLPLPAPACAVALCFARFAAPCGFLTDALYPAFLYRANDALRTRAALHAHGVCQKAYGAGCDARYAWKPPFSRARCEAAQLILYVKLFHFEFASFLLTFCLWSLGFSIYHFINFCRVVTSSSMTSSCPSRDVARHTGGPGYGWRAARG